MLLFSPVVFATEPLVDINRAGAQELAKKLTGIGPAKSRAIVVYRELHGPFKKVDDLIKVKGIGPRTLEKNRAQRVIEQKKTRRAVRSVIEAARRDSIKDKH